MANRFWVGDGGSWNDTAHWSTTSGGTGGASVPGSSDDVIFDANSFTLGGQVITTGTVASMRGFDTSACLHTPSISFASLSIFAVRGSFDSSGITFTNMRQNLGLNFAATSSGLVTIKTGGTPMPSAIFQAVASNVTFQLLDSFISNNDLFEVVGGNNSVFDFNGQTVSAYVVEIAGSIAFSNATINVGANGAGLLYLSYGSNSQFTGGTINLLPGVQVVMLGSQSPTTLAGTSPTDKLTINNNSGAEVEIIDGRIQYADAIGTNSISIIDVGSGGGGGPGPGTTGFKVRHVRIPTHFGII